MDVKKLRPHPENNRIYSTQDLSELEHSLMTYGQLEPLAVTKDNKIISGHRRFSAMCNLGFEDVEVRIVTPDNELVSLVEHNRHRTKTASDILNEARVLGEQLKGIVGRGRVAAKKRGGKRTTVVHEIASKMGIGPSSLKQLMSISNYEHELIEKVDTGELSIGAAYQQVREKYILPKRKTSKSVSKTVPDAFDQRFKTFLAGENVQLDQINNVLRQTYPYCLEMTGIDADKRADLIDYLEQLRSMDSRQYMLRQKFDELEHGSFTKTQLKRAKKLLPTHEDIEKWWMKGVTANVKKDSSYHFMDDVRVIEVGKEEGFDNELWRMFRVHATSFEHSDGPGRMMRGIVGFDTPKGFKLLGICSLHSDSHTLGVRDSHIGWTDSQRAANREHLVNMNVCVPTQPFGFNRLGGKFISLATLDLIPKWERKYKTKIVGVITTSLHGPQSMYNGMHNFWRSVGTTSGAMSIMPDRDRYGFWRDWFKTNYPTAFDDTQEQSSPKQGLLNAIYKVLNINRKDFEHGQKRGVYICPLYHNYKDFLCNEIKIKELEPKRIDWHEWWHKSARKRFEKISKEKRVQNDQLWIESINELDIENWLNASGL
jgi:hypothetical protein